MENRWEIKVENQGQNKIFTPQQARASIVAHQVIRLAGQ